jgi:hypothetical protein
MVPIIPSIRFHTSEFPYLFFIYFSFIQKVSQLDLGFVHSDEKRVTCWLKFFLPIPDNRIDRDPVGQVIDDSHYEHMTTGKCQEQP